MRIEVMEDSSARRGLLVLSFAVYPAGIVPERGEDWVVYQLQTDETDA